MQIIDISLPIHSKMITYPGNPVFATEEFKHYPPLRNSLMHIGSHTGTHIDAPRHGVRNGKGIDQMSLTDFIGPCRVLDITTVKDFIRVADLKKYKVQRGERILVKTKNSLQGFKKFYKKYIFMDPLAAAFLAQKRITLFGIDYLSVKQSGNPDQGAHTAFLSKNISIIEGLDLSKVKAGNYFLMAIPLRLVGLDASPIRAVLIK